MIGSTPEFDQPWLIDPDDEPIAPKTLLTRSKLLAKDPLFDVFRGD